MFAVKVSVQISDCHGDNLVLFSRVLALLVAPLMLACLSCLLVISRPHS